MSSPSLEGSRPDWVKPWATRPGLMAVLSRRLGQGQPKGRCDCSCSEPSAPGQRAEPAGRAQQQLFVWELGLCCWPGLTTETMRFPTSNSLFLGDNHLLYFKCSSFFSCVFITGKNFSQVVFKIKCSGSRSHVKA